MRSRAGLAGLGMLLAASALTACDDASGSARPVDRYVALGDSYTSGAGLPRERHPDTGVCGQSSLSYPNLVARALGAQLVDASCGGATTDNATRPQPRGAGRPEWPPQLDSVTADADLVTVGLGINDLGWYAAVMFDCTTLAAQDPTGDPCEQHSGSTGLTAMPTRIGAHVERLLQEVHDRAPDARVLLVGYPQPVPAEGTCAELPLAAGDYPFVRDQWERVDEAMRKAADEAGATFVDVMGPSEGHDICAGADAWVSGSAPPAGVAAAYHPLRQGQAAVAKLVEQALAG